MNRITFAGALLGALAVAGPLAGPPLAHARGSVRPVVHFPAGGVGGEQSHTCFWGTAYTQETRNIVWPDSHTGYPVSLDTIPAGGKIVLHGRFPHGRFFSMTAASPLGVLRGHLYDTQIKPDRGSTNPFRPGANRNAKHRSYTITVVDKPDPGPGHERTNVLYAGLAGQAPGAGALQIVQRLYLPDRGRDFTGGVGVPAVRYVDADGKSRSGKAACAALSTKPGAKYIVDFNKMLFPETTIKQLLAESTSPEHPAVKSTVWYKYFGPQWLFAPYYAGTDEADKIASLPLTSTGLGANPANGYVFAWLDRSFGPNRHGHNIAVLHGELPTTPATYARERRAQGGKQMRYWSMCNNEGLTSGKTTGPCLADEETPINAKRRYTIVVSLRGDRPQNATGKCGVAWMNWGTKGDGYTRPRSTMMVMRNLTTTAHPAFPHAVQNVADPAKVKHVMGAYLPKVTYTTAARFEKHGCKTG